MNCFTPKPAIKKPIQKDKNILLFSRSADNLNRRPQYDGTRVNMSNELKNSKLSLNSLPKYHEFENINNDLYKRHDNSDFKLNLDHDHTSSQQQSDRPIQNQFIWVSLFESKKL